jgi:hypothetical protein
MATRFAPAYRVLNARKAELVEWAVGDRISGFSRELVSAPEPFASWVCAPTSSWGADLSGLRITASVNAEKLAREFVDAGFAVGSAANVAVVWASPQTKRRGMSAPLNFRPSRTSGAAPLNFEINFAPGELRGTLEISLHAFSSVPGDLPEPPVAGCSIGQIGLLQRVYVDGRGGYLPIREVAGGRDQGLWRLELPSDVVDDFWFTRIDSDDLALVLNSDHPDFPLLTADDGSFTALYWEVFAGWASMLVFVVSRRDDLKGSEMHAALQDGSRRDGYPNLAMLYRDICRRIPEAEPTELSAAQIGELIRAYIARGVLSRRTSRPSKGV